MGRVEQLIAHLEILCKRGAINIGQAPRATVCETYSAPGETSRKENQDRSGVTETGHVNGMNDGAGVVSMEHGRLRS